MAKTKESQAELELEDDKTKKDTDGKEEVIVTEDKDTSKVNDDAEKAIAELKEQMAKIDSDRKAAVERADKLQKERDEEAKKAQEANGKVASTQKDAIEQAIKASGAALEMHRKELKAALEAGDSDKVVEQQEKLAEATYLNSEVKKNKVAYEQWEKAQEAAAKQPKVQELPPSVKQWIDKNPRYNNDPEFKDEADAAHDAAIRRGYQFGSTAYLGFIDSRIKLVFEGNSKAETKEAKIEVEDKPAKQFSAPPSRGSGDSSNSSGGGKKYKLTAEQVEAAEFMNMTPLEYAQYIEKEKDRK